MHEVKHWLDSQIIFFRHFWDVGKPQQSWSWKPGSVSLICTDFLTDSNWTLSFFPTAIYFVSACEKCTVLLFKILKKELNEELSQLNYNLIEYLGSTDFIGNGTYRKRELQVLWHFVASWESPDADGSPGVWVLLWLVTSDMHTPALLACDGHSHERESVVSKCLVSLPVKG